MINIYYRISQLENRDCLCREPSSTHSASFIRKSNRHKRFFFLPFVKDGQGRWRRALETAKLDAKKPRADTFHPPRPSSTQMGKHISSVTLQWAALVRTRTLSLSLQCVEGDGRPRSTCHNSANARLPRPMKNN